VNGDERSFGQLQKELEDVLQQLERGDLDVDEVVGLWQRGEQLYRLCAARLEAVELRIEELGARPPGES
jgi:exodeoxyribonuclease VII small subunit